MELIIRILCIFAIVLVGLGAAKLKWLSLDSSKFLSIIVINIAAPCVVITSMANHELDSDSLRATAILFGLFFLMFFVVAGISGPIASLAKIEPERRGVYKNFLLLSNNGFLGFPIAAIIFSQTGVFYLVIGNIVMFFFIYSFSVIYLLKSKPNEEANGKMFGVKAILKELVNLPLISSLVGLLIFLFQIPLPGDVIFLMDTLGAMMAPLAMMVIGIQLSESHIKRLILNHRLLIMCFFRLILIPGLVFSIMLVFVYFQIIDRLQASVVTINFAFPCAAMGVILAEQYKSDVLYASEGTFLSTFFSIFTLPIVGMLLAIFVG